MATCIICLEGTEVSCIKSITYCKNCESKDPKIHPECYERYIHKKQKEEMEKQQRQLDDGIIKEINKNPYIHCPYCRYTLKINEKERRKLEISLMTRTGRLVRRRKIF